ncbi:MAG: hypothetical protein ACM3S1_09910 [Hyphomicrobiales bacterium]
MAGQQPPAKTPADGSNGGQGGKGASFDPETDIRPYDDATEALRAMNSYYNAVNLGDFERAYGYWRNPPQSLDEFRQGYADTAYSIGTFEAASDIDAAAGSRHQLVAAVIRAKLNDGTEQLFSGCYAMYRAAPGVSDDPADELWRIDEASIAPADSNAAIRALLDAGCQPWADRVAHYDAPYDNRTGSINVVYSLYDAVNRKDFDRAYGYWEQPPASKDDFIAGYADTASTAITVGAPADRGAAAGSVYDEVPIVLQATKTDGTVQRFSGCYVLRRANVPTPGHDDPTTNPWGIYSAQIAPAPLDADIAVLLRDGCTNTP